MRPLSQSRSSSSITSAGHIIKLCLNLECRFFFDLRLLSFLLSGSDMLSDSVGERSISLFNMLPIFVGLWRVSAQ